MKYISWRPLKMIRIFKPQSDDGFFDAMVGSHAGPTPPRERERKRDNGEIENTIFRWMSYLTCQSETNWTLHCIDIYICIVLTTANAHTIGNMIQNDDVGQKNLDIVHVMQFWFRL